MSAAECFRCGDAVVDGTCVTCLDKVFCANCDSRESVAQCDRCDRPSCEECHYTARAGTPDEWTTCAMCVDDDDAHADFRRKEMTEEQS